MALPTFSLCSYYLGTCPLTLNCELFLRKDQALFTCLLPQAACFEQNTT